jgi:hypothetical protein
MGWTIVTPCPEFKRARKEYKEGKNVSDFSFNSVLTAIEQPLKNEESLTLRKLYDLLVEVDRDDDNAFLMRGTPVGQNEDGTYGMTDAYWIDCSSKHFQLDLDEETDHLSQDASLETRVELALEELPFLKHCRFIAQLSSSAGLGKVLDGKKEKDYRKRYCLRLWVEFDRAFTGEEIAYHLSPYSDFLDLSLCEPTRRHYIRRALHENTESLLKDKTHLKYYEGEALSLKEIKGFEPKYKPKEGRNTLKKTNKALKKNAKPWNTIQNVARKYVIQELEKDAENGYCDSQRNNIFGTLFRREQLFSSGDCALLIDEILNSPALLGDWNEKKLNNWAKSSGKRVLRNLKLEAEGWRKSNFQHITNFNEIDLANRDWSDLLNYRASAIRSCMGTNKTKGVLYDLVKNAKASGKSVLIITPLVAVTEQIADDLGIDHYHSRGTDRSQKLSVFNKSKHLVTCYQSLELFKELNQLIPQFDIVITDEASQVFRNWADPTNHLESMDMYFNLLDRSKNAILLDADIDDELCLWGLSRIANFQPETSALYYNCATYLRNYEISLEDNYGKTIEKILKTIKSGKRTAIFTDWSDEKYTLSAFLKYIERKTGKKGKAFDSETVRTRAPELKTHPNKTISGWIKKNELDFILVSPWCNCGWDYIEKGYDFDEVFVISTHQFFSAQKIKQMLRRFRMTRKASVYLSGRKEVVWENETFDAIKKHKGKTESDLERMDAWQVRAKQAHKKDLANVPWLLEDSLRDKGAIVEKVETTEEEAEKYNETAKDWDAFRKQAEKEYLANKETPREETLRVLDNFKRAAPHAFIDLDISNLSDHQIESLSKRDKKIDANKAKRFGRLLVADEEERKEEDENHILSFNYVLGKLLDAFWFEIGELVDQDAYISFAHWYADPKSEPIYGTFDFINTSALANIMRKNQDALKEEFPNLGHDSWKEPNRILRPLVHSFDLIFRTKKEMDKLPKDQRLSAKEAKKELFDHYQKTNEKGFNPKGKVNQKNDWCLLNISKKLNENKKLHHTEQMFLFSKPSGFEIKRKNHVSKVFLEEMELAKRRLEDKLGLSQNHTKYCSCIDCQESKIIGFAK